MTRISKHAYLRAAMKAAGIKRLHLGGFWPKTPEQNKQVTIFTDMLTGMGFDCKYTGNTNELLYTKDDESVIVNIRFGKLGLQAFWLNAVT
jgi:hypothetical protein